jgi:RimJ/RimL family protein N-acetyltransferase
MDSIGSPLITSPRLMLTLFTVADAADVFACITPSITRFLPWEAPASFDDYMRLREQRSAIAGPRDFSFVIRLKDSGECLGMTSLERTDEPLPELGIWLKEAAHRQGYAYEAVTAVINWASAAFGCEHYQWPVATENVASRRIAEMLNGEVIATRSKPKYDLLVYRVR